MITFTNTQMIQLQMLDGNKTKKIIKQFTKHSFMGNEL